MGQLILDDLIGNGCGAECNIICTQPRRYKSNHLGICFTLANLRLAHIHPRLSAIAVAERVAEERAEKVGQTVGYSVRLEHKTSRDTRLLFCTTGVLLRRLQSDAFLEDVSHVIVDEVHERDLDRYDLHFLHKIKAHSI